MASSPRTKIRIASSVLLASGFWDALAGRFVWQTLSASPKNLPVDTQCSTDDVNRYTDRAGAIHIHSTYSDGAGDVPTVMEGAKEAGVDFVLLTDHNTQRPKRDGWEERYNGDNGYPLLLIGTEITVEKGAFLLALDMPAEWEPTKHQPPQVAIDEVNAHRGIPLVSLPFDIKHPWEAWDATGCIGLEVVNLSTVARRHINIPSLLWLVPLGRQRGMMAALRALLTRPDAALERWDSLLAAGTPQVGIGALDAHALMKIGKKKYPIPNYPDSMRVLTTHMLIPLEADRQGGEATRKAIYQAFRKGNCYFSYDCLGDPRPFTFQASAGTNCVTMGERIARANGVVQMVVRSREKSLVQLYRNGTVIASGIGGITYTATEPGPYRVEVSQVGGRTGSLFWGVRPWIFSNPIYVA
ncbi:MAG: CehA/McbA family metallohydrolase [Armatimonadaceae bacterium]